MKKRAKLYLKLLFKATIVLVVFFGATETSYAQNTNENEQEVDSVKTGVALGKLKLGNPDSIVSKYTYDPNLDYYIYTETVGEFDVSYPIILTPKQYYKLVREEGMKSYFKEKIDAFSGKKDGSEEARKNLLPNFYVNNDFFESIFGGNTIEVIPQGSVAIDLGVLLNKNDNPALSPRNRGFIPSFDFDQRISLSMLGKVGERLQVTANYDTEATFDFQNLVKLDYAPTEDDILQKIEIGNVSMPLNSSLIQGAQSLFGVKTQLQFGKTTVTAVFADQKSQQNTVVAQGGGTVNEYSLTALDYDEDKHFFLSQYFRDNYDKALEKYPYIQSQVQITRLEVWVTNRSQQTLNVRNVVAIQDLGEALPSKTRIGQNGNPAGFFNNSANDLPRNNANNYNPEQIGDAANALNDNIRDISTVQQGFNIPGYTVNQGFDYSILENARKLEQNRDYVYNPQLGYISLNQRLSNDEILAVAFQYTFGGQVYQVGEFANGGVEATTVNTGVNNTVVDNNTLVVKLLKSSITQVNDPIWDLMMKNIYATGAFRLSQEDFKLNILYSETTPRNYITPVVDFPAPESGEKPLQERILLDVFNLDRLNAYNDIQPGGDGFFDFIPGITVDTQNGRIIFTKVEPFGEYIHEKLGGGTYDVDNDQGYNENQQKYVYRSMYASTKARAREDAEKNRFLIKGRYKSEGSNGIPIGAFNVPRGSVRVTAGGRQLQEGIDYTVNYQAGTVQIIDPSLEASNTPINISVENNAVFGQQTRRFTGINVEHTINKNFVLGGTYLRMNERPLTQKSNFGTEPVNNTIFGFNGNFSTEVPFLTRLANKLPNIDTDAPSNISIRGEVALLKPGSPKNADFEGETTSYVDDFEGAQALIDIRSSLGWSLASTPLEIPSGDVQGLDNGIRRAKMSWFTIDPTFYSNQRPSGITDSDISSNETRRIFIDEVFDQQVAQGQTQVQNTLNLAYYPTRKGPYNNNTDADFVATPEQNWAGIMRPLSSTNFEQSNVEFLQFWVLDPYVDGITTSPGELVFNLGNISEDILKDGKKQYENGLPNAAGDDFTESTSWGGKVPSTQALVYAFDVDEASRALQDIGYDGLNDADEASVFTNGPSDDPALDNYQYFLSREGGILERYLDFNNPEGNSPVQVTNNTRGSTTLPDVEDVDRDLTMNTVDSYFEYRIDIKPGTSINDKYVSDILETGPAPTGSVRDGRSLNRRWIQYKIPLSDFTNATNGITDFRSISFMRMYLTGFSSDAVLRFATLDLVRGDWRTYTKTLESNEDDPSDDATQVDVNTVNIQENGNRNPIPYVLPPGVFREQLNNNNTIIDQNEQSLSFVVNDLEPEDSRGVFKNINYDIRQYKKLKMFMHAEEIMENDYVDGATPLVGFLRIGTDFSENFYQIETPLQFTPHGGSRDENVIWPEENSLDISLADLNKIKSFRIANKSTTPLNELRFFEVVNGEVMEVGEFSARTSGQMRIGIQGNPSLGSIRSMMVGVKNIDNLPARGEVWFNELRLAGLDNNGGWAAVAAIDANMADFANVSVTGRRSTSGFGSVDQMPNERAREDGISYDLVSNINAGQLLPKKWGIQLPFNYGISEETITPEFDPVYDDLKLKDRIAAAATAEDAKKIEQQAQDYTKRTSINFIGVRKDRGEDAEANFYDIENFTFNYSYNETNHRDFEIASLTDQNVNAGMVYNHSFKPATVAPFAKKDSLFNGSYWKWLKELNFNLLPTSVSIASNINRSFNQQKFRDVFEEDIDALELPSLQQRNYLFNWRYTLNYSLSKSLRVNITGSNDNIVRNYFNEPGNSTSGINQDLVLWDGFFDIGEPNRHNQNMQISYELPLSKIPALSFINAQYAYTSNFDWQRGGEAVREAIGDDISTVQNASTHNLTAALNMQKFYDYIGLKKKGGKGNSRSRKPVKKDKAGKPIEDKKKTKKTSKLANTVIDIVTAIKRVNVSYSENGGKVLPGYTQSTGFIGTIRPSLGFVFGSQADVRFNAARNGWLTTFPEFNQQYIENSNKQLNITATAQPIKDLTIDISADRQFSESYQENFQVVADGAGNLQYNDLLGNKFGNFSISTSMISTAFKKSDEFSSEAFEAFKENRITVANRVEAENGNQSANIDTDGFPGRYGKTSQDVLLPAFIAAYTGQKANKVKLGAFKNIPIPNWNLKYTGLMKNKWFKKKFKRFSLSHGYRASYSINSFQTNLEKENTETDLATGDVLPDLILNNVVLTDQFNPLMRVDFEMKNSLSVLAEVRTDRTLSLSFDNNLLTEINGKEYTLGLGYRFKDVKFVTNIGGEKTRLKGDLNLKADVTMRDNITIIRNLELDNNQITSGQNLFSVKFTADYALSKNLNALFFYDHSFSQFAVSTAFPQTTINAGFTIKYNFGN